MSNQVIGSLPNLGNLGGTSGINFGSIAGTQYITLNPATVGAAPTVDGTKDAAYGSAQAGWLQSNFTGFGVRRSAVFQISAYCSSPRPTGPTIFGMTRASR